MGEKILVADDDADSLKLISLMLQRHGYDIVVADSGQQTLSMAASEEPDLIILDIMMPELDGYEVCRRLRRDPATQAVPIIMFTAKTLVDDKVAGFEAGVDDYLTKPTHPAELTSRVKAVLERRAARRNTRADRAYALGFIGCKGGVGTTSLAINVAASFGQDDTTILADFCPGQGTVGLSLGVSRSSGMANLLSRPHHDITASAVERELVPHGSGLRLLLSSASPKESLMAMSPDHATTIVRHLRTLSRHVLLDLGAGLSKVTANLLPELDQVTLTTEPNRVALTLARELLVELEHSGIDQDHINIVLINRTQTTVSIPWQEAEQILGHEMTAIISSAPELALQAAEAGAPIVLFQPGAAVSGQLTKLAGELTARIRATAGTGLLS